MKEYTPEITWKTKEGKIISVKEMETSHIVNSAKMMARNGHDWKEIFGKELRGRKVNTLEIKKEEVEHLKDLEEWCGMCSRPDYACKCYGED